MSDCLRVFLDPELHERGVEFAAPRPGDAGFDLRAFEDEEILPGCQVLLRTGVRLAIPKGWVGLVRDRSSMALNRIYSHAGVIDSAYRGEVQLVLSNGGSEPYRISAGAKVAQLLVVPCCTALEVVPEASQLGETDRGEGGFGSTGR